MELNESEQRFIKIHSKIPVLGSNFNSEPATLLKRDSSTVFPENFAKSSRTAILQNTCERLLVCFVILCQSTLIFISTFYFGFNFLGQLIAILIFLLENNLSLEKQLL